MEAHSGVAEGMNGDRQARKQRAILVAAAGWLLALVVLFTMRELGLTQIRPSELWGLGIATAAAQTILWWIPRRGLDRYLTWDPHYLYVPLMTAVLFLTTYTYFAPEAGSLLLLAWFVSLLFVAGLARFIDVLMLSGLVALGHLSVIALRALGGYELDLRFEVLQIAVFFAICTYAAFILHRVRVEREKMRFLRRELADLAMKDSLTGLPNRRHFEECVREELTRAERYGGTFCVAMVDVDHFKVYNDTLGHLPGDQVLRELAKLLQTNLRDNDVAARYGGEEFSIIMVDASLEEALEVVERLRAVVELYPFVREEILPLGQLTISAGIAACGAGRYEYEAVIQEADRALYAAKHAGRNQVHLAA